jgi:hypothetical protein
VHVAVEHELDADAARAAIERAFAHYQQKYAKYKPHRRWLDERRLEVTFAAKGVVIHGLVKLEPGRIVMEAKVPVLLRPFTKKAVTAIQGELGKWLGASAES